MLHLYAALAEKERRLISQRTKDALAARKAQGMKLAAMRDKSIQNAPRPRLGPRIAADAGGAVRLVGQRDRGELNRRGVATPTGSPWSAKTVSRVQKRLEFAL